ncbi:MAG TPA: BldC family transcriptional regulator [Acidimicrobiia bacterium]|jgi:excisionase family DNA binding protein|nr:BldC family transcriptional regulator [Acidimicrobiia bacterium]
MTAAHQADLLTPGEVAALFRVNAKTVTRWARAGKISTVRTLGGHRRFRRNEVEACLSARRAFDV